MARSRAATSPGLDQARDPKPLEVMADERLAEPDVGDELGHAGLAVGQATHDAQPVHVGEGLVEGAQLAQVVGLEDDRGDGRAESGGGRHGWAFSRGRRSRESYQRRLISTDVDASRRPCQPGEVRQAR